MLTNNKTISYKNLAINTKEKYLNNINSDEMIREINSYKDKTTYNNCIINSLFIHNYLCYIENDIEIVNSIVEIDLSSVDYYLLTTIIFKNCKIFFVDGFEKKEFIKNLSINNRIYNHSYLEYILNTKGVINKEDISGFSLKNIDLSNIKLPIDNDFFSWFGNTVITDVKFSNIDFSLYNTSGITFNRCNFSDNCKESVKMINNIKNSILSKNVGQALHNMNVYVSMGNTFHKDTTFPKNKDFFIKHSFFDNKFPELDFTLYNINEGFLIDNIFDENSYFPAKIENITSNNLYEKMKIIPKHKITYCCLFGHFKNPCKFYKTYKKHMTIYDKLVFCKRYDIKK